MRPASRLRLTTAIAASILAMGPEILPEEPREGPPPPRCLVDPERAKAAGSLHWVLSHVRAGGDEWATEELNDVLGARLDALKHALVEAPAVAAEVQPLLAPGFEGEPAWPAAEEPVLATAAAAAWVGRDRPEKDSATGGTERVGGAAWAAGLSRLRSAFARVAKAKIKVFGIEPSAAAGPGSPSGAVTRVLIEIDGVEPAGAFLQLRTEWRIDWVQTSAADRGSWRMAAVDVLSFERAAMTERGYRDATAELLQHNASYREQLLTGVADWRLRLDAASGIDIYGHNGIALGDVDGDGLEDLYVAQPGGLPNLLFRQRADGRFDDVTRESGLDILDETGGPLFVDLDNDGDLDLVLPTSLEVLLYENDGRGKFRRHGGSGLEKASSRQTTTLGAAAADYDLDGDLDLYVFSYIFWAGAGSKLHSTYPFPYHDANNGAPNFLFRNEGALRFSDVTAESGMDENNRRFSFAASWCDFDDDGDADLFVANDFGKDSLYVNDRGRFRDRAAELGVDDPGNGMSATWEDVDNDGWIDLYVGNMWSSAGNRIAIQPRFATAELRSVYLRMARGNSLFKNEGGRRFTDATETCGASFGRWAWSCQFFDVEADGLEDLHVTNGFLTGPDPADL